jgi:SAM-dependent methyltransferase
MDTHDITTRDVLTGDAYATSHHLAARQSLYSWQRPTFDLPGIVLNRLSSGSRLVVDIGCGNGKYLRRLREERRELASIGVDISAGVLADIAHPLAVADAARLPFASARADVLLAMHMLYHVEDIDLALAEFKRVLRPGGTLFVSTNSSSDKSELDALWSKAAGDVLGVREGPRRVSLSSRFPLDDAPEILGRYFQDIELVPLRGRITVPESAPVIAHLASYRTWADTLGVPFDATIQRARERVDAHIDQHGAFTVTADGGMLICSAR